MNPSRTPTSRARRPLMARLRRLARRGSLLWILLLLAGGTSALSGLARPRHAPARAAATSAELRDEARILELFRGIPQDGATLGDPNAPAELIQFADLQCPYCAAVNTTVLPQIIEQYVRPGKLKLVFRPLSFVGPNSERAARAAAAVGLQNRLWEFVDLAFRNQGAENSGGLDDSKLSGLAASIPGVDVRRAMSDRAGSLVTAQLQGSSAQADALGVEGTPAFFLRKGVEAPRRVDATNLRQTLVAMFGNGSRNDS